MKTEPLTPIEMQAWRDFRRSAELIASRIASDITRVTGLSAADFTILMQLNMDKQGQYRQRDLQSLLEWDKTRLSHQLTRMAGRGLIARLSEGGHTMIKLTDAGRQQLILAAPVHQQGVKDYFSDRLSAEELAIFISVSARLRHSP